MPSEWIRECSNIHCPNPKKTIRRPAITIELNSPNDVHIIAEKAINELKEQPITFCGEIFSPDAVLAPGCYARDETISAK